MIYPKQLVEDAIALCPSALIRSGEIGGVLDGRVQYFIHTPLREVRLRYVLPDGTEQDYALPLETTSCHFGGVRWWIRCWCCERRRRTLYLPENRPLFTCRGCYRLGYRTQRLQPIQRAALAWRGLNARYPAKRPRGMWRRTYWRGRLFRDVAEYRVLRQFAGRRVGDSSSNNHPRAI
jgi:hypothetical protein